MFWKQSCFVFLIALGSCQFIVQFPSDVNVCGAFVLDKNQTQNLYILTRTECIYLKCVNFLY